jgi:gliding motility-associated-like protein
MEYGDTIALTATVNEPAGASFNWFNVSNNSPLTDSTISILISPTDLTIYRFTAISPLGCEVDTTVIITVSKPRRASAPSAFTPNGDGTNDTFFVQGDDKVNSIKVFRVFDRWGEMVYEGLDLRVNDPTQGWDGSFKGVMMNSGTYAWYAEVEYIDGQSEIIRGDVTLLR